MVRVLVNLDVQNRLNLIEGIDQPIAGLFYVLKVKLRVDYLNNDHFIRKAIILSLMNTWSQK